MVSDILLAYDCMRGVLVSSQGLLLRTYKNFMLQWFHRWIFCHCWWIVALTTLIIIISFLRNADWFAIIFRYFWHIFYVYIWFLSFWLINLLLFWLLSRNMWGVLRFLFHSLNFSKLFTALIFLKYKYVLVQRIDKINAHLFIHRLRKLNCYFVLIKISMKTWLQCKTIKYCEFFIKYYSRCRLLRFLILKLTAMISKHLRLFRK